MNRNFSHKNFEGKKKNKYTQNEGKKKKKLKFKINLKNFQLYFFLIIFYHFFFYCFLSPLSTESDKENLLKIV